MLSIFGNVVLPVLAIAMLGYLLERTMKPSLPTLSRVTLYVFSPALVFSSLTKTTLSGQDALQIVGFSLAFTATMMVVTWVLSRLGRLERDLSRAFMLSILFMNAGNYGLSVNLLAFGQDGLGRAVVFFVVQAVLGGTLGVYIAASSSSIGLLPPLLAALRMPMLYAGLAALAVNFGQVGLPLFVSRSMDIVGGAAIPMMLVVLGMQLAQSSALDSPFTVGVAVAVRLVVSVFVAFGLLALMGVEGMTRNVLLVQAAMPTAVFIIIVATEFDARPRFVTSVVLASTAVSIVTVTVLLSVLLGTTSLF